MLPLEKFETIDYNVGVGKALQMKNILPVVLLTKNRYVRYTYIQHYDIRDGERPEMLAKRLYNEPELYWVFLLLNDIVDPITQWYMDSESLDAFVDEKYKNHGGRDGIHHFYDTGNKRIIDDVDAEKLYPLIGKRKFPSDIQIVTNFEYESELNSTRRRIKVLSKKAVAILVNHIDNFFSEIGRSNIDE